MLMWTDAPEDRAFVAELSRDVIAEVAPEEIALFDQLVAEYYADPTAPDRAAQADDDALGLAWAGRW